MDRMIIFMDRAASTGGDVDKYEAELKKMFEQLTALRNLLETAKSQAAQSETVNNEVARLTALLMEADLNFSEFDDVTIRRIVECIQVNTDKHILVTLKGGLQGEELIRKAAQSCNDFEPVFMGCVKCSYKENLRKKQVKKSFILDFFSGCFSVALSH